MYHIAQRRLPAVAVALWATFCLLWLGLACASHSEAATAIGGSAGCKLQLPMYLKRLECSACGLEHEWSHLQNLCRACSKPLFAIVDLAAASRTMTRETLLARDKSLWRYREVLPLPSDVEPVSLGEGSTPLLRAERVGNDVELWIKDESI